MIRTSCWVAAGICWLAAAAAHAEVQPTPGAADSRVRTVIYRSEDVVEIIGHVGYATTIFFEAGEQVNSVALGDDIWHVVPEGDRISIKPRSNAQVDSDRLSSEADTNMTVFTDRRTYFFDLKASTQHDPERLTYAVLFRYPRSPAEAADRQRAAGARRLSTGAERTLGDAQATATSHGVAPPSGRDRQGRYWSYTWQGAVALRPLNVFDDGRFIYLRFRAGVPLPAVFFAEADGQETIANFHVRGEWIILHRVGSKVILRDGSLVTCVFREGSG